MSALSVAAVLRRQRKIPWERFVARGGHPALIMDSIRRCNVRHLRSVIGLPNLRYWKRYNEISYFHAGELRAVQRTLRDWVRQTPRRFLTTVEKLNALLDSAVTWARRYEQADFSAWSDAELASFFVRLIEWTDRVWASAYVPMFADAALRSYVVDGGVCSLEELARYTAPHQLTLLQRKHNELWRLRQRYGRRPPARALHAFIKKYAYSRSYLLHVRPYDLAAVREELAQMHGPVRLPRVVIPGRLRRYRDVLEATRSMVDFRDQRMLKISHFFYRLHQFFCEFARRLGLTYDEFVQLTVDEVRSQRFSRAELARRQRGVGYVVLRGVGYTLTGRDLAALKRVGEQVSASQLTGLTAFAGLVRGRVRKVNPYTYDRIRSGDIIVTGMTTPEIVPYLTKVKAMVTDEGGLTAHVSIVAREFKIPCVIGTKVATQVLKDGDRVEVDATKGIVRKL